MARIPVINKQDVLKAMSSIEDSGRKPTIQKIQDHLRANDKRPGSSAVISRWMKEVRAPDNRTWVDKLFDGFAGTLYAEIEKRSSGNAQTILHLRERISELEKTLEREREIASGERIHLHTQTDEIRRAAIDREQALRDRLDNKEAVIEQMRLRITSLEIKSSNLEAALQKMPARQESSTAQTG